ncbi:TRAM domain-containing protein [Halorientalis sp.]|uniref:TRAM domain-containing protein n=1 Tax=Halorientalis sp. TaxID=1931229 RepID=UPI00261187C3|nr:TRAM domain-containing protein [Halorientalis sp.]
MPDCPLADDCPSFSERIEGMGCQHYGDRGGAEWCNHYNQPIRDLKEQPVQPGEEVVVTVEDIHESGAGVGRTGDGFIVMVDGVLPEARARVQITRVHSNHAKAEEIERLPLEEEAEADDGDRDGDGEADDSGADDEAADADGAAADDLDARDEDPHLGSRDNFWGS